MPAILKTFSLSVLIAVLLLGMLSLAGFPTQRLMDLGAALNYRLVSVTSQHTVTNQSSISSTEAEFEDQPKLLVPSTLYAVEGQTLRIYYDNLVLSRDSEQYQFNITCDCVHSYGHERRSWSVKASEQGELPLTLKVTDSSNKTLDSAQSLIRIASTNAGENKEIRLLLVGDSITRQSWWPNMLAELLNLPGNPVWSMIGRAHEGDEPLHQATHPNVYHEGVPGWSFGLFANFNNPELAEKFHREKSPFVFGNSRKNSKLDISRYYAEQAEGKPADFVVLQLGINDLWSPSPNDVDAFEKKMDLALNNATNLINAFKLANPDTQIGIMLPAPFTRSDRTFYLSYGESKTRLEARESQHKLVSALMSEFSSKENEGIWLIPVQAIFDTLDGYPTNNAGHPNQYGHSQIAEAVYSWLKWVLQ